MHRTLTLTVLTLAMTAGAALGDLVDDAGGLIDWGVTPFTLPNQSDTFDGTLWLTIQNDYAPIDYPGGVGYEPSPGGSGGEVFDLEEMYVRVTPSQIGVLVVASAGPAAEVSGSTIYLGDLMLAAGGHLFGIVTTSASQGLAPGSIYRLDGDGDVVQLQPGSRTYADNTSLRPNDYGPDATIAEIAGPWAVSGGIDPGQRVGLADIQTDTYDYGGGEDGTFLIQYQFDLAALGIGLPDTWTTKITWGCGNDVIRVQDDIPFVPEPATFGLLVVGVGLSYLAKRRRRRT